MTPLALTAEQRAEWDAEVRTVLTSWDWEDDDMPLLLETMFAALAPLIAALVAEKVGEEREACAQIVDRCNREGPYNAIGAASRIRARKGTP